MDATLQQGQDGNAGIHGRTGTLAFTSFWPPYEHTAQNSRVSIMQFLQHTGLVSGQVPLPRYPKATIPPVACDRLVM